MGGQEATAAGKGTCADPGEALLCCCLGKALFTRRKRTDVGMASRSSYLTGKIMRVFDYQVVQMKGDFTCLK